MKGKLFVSKISLLGIFFLLLLTLFFSLRTGVFSAQPVEISRAQYVLYIPFLFFVWLAFRKVFYQITPSVLLAFLGATASAGYAFSVSSTQTSSFLVARFLGDEMEQQSHIFRDRLNQRLTELGGETAGRFYRSFDGSSDLRKAFSEEGPSGVNKLRGLVWGDTNRINISFLHHVDQKPRVFSFSDPWTKTVHRVKLIRHVPAISMAYHPVRPGVEFLSHLLAARGITVQSKHAERELLLLGAARNRATWSSFSHLAYPYWLLGNDYIERAFEQAQPELGYAQCAHDVLAQAGAYLAPYDNPSLRAAVLNNKGVLLTGEALSRGDRKELKRAKRHFEDAARIAQRPGGVESRVAIASLARGNLQRAKALLESSREAIDSAALLE